MGWEEGIEVRNIGSRVGLKPTLAILAASVLIIRLYQFSDALILFNLIYLSQISMTEMLKIIELCNFH